MKKIAVIFLLAFLQACSSEGPQTPEQHVRATLEAIELAAQERSLSGIMDHVSDNYRDHEGKTKKEIQRIAQIYLIANQKIHIFTRISSIEVVDNIAAVELSAAMSATETDLTNEQGRLRADTHRFSLVLTLENDDWRLTSASWQRGW